MLLIVAACAIGCASASGASPDEQVVLALRGQAQEAAQWCWAAGSQSVLHFLAPELGAEVCQCRQVEARSPGLRCCASPDSCAPAQPLNADCRDLGWPDLRRYGFDFETTCDPLPQSRWESCRGRPLGWDALVAELRSGRPAWRGVAPRRAPAHLPPTRLRAATRRAGRRSSSGPTATRTSTGRRATRCRTARTTPCAMRSLSTGSRSRPSSAPAGR